MRYAIYFTPAQDDLLTRRAAAWLGYDAYTGQTSSRRLHAGFGEAELASLTDEPRRYGFHATLKAPFELCERHTEAEMLAAFDSFAESMEAFEIPQIALGQLGDFFALVPTEWNPQLQLFASECVSRFDGLRAPLKEADIARRKSETLTESQRSNLMIWGYPYVHDDFRFHMTLTGRVPAERQRPMRQLLEHEFADHIGKPLQIDRIALFVEPERGQKFTVRHSARLRAPTLRKTA